MILKGLILEESLLVYLSKSPGVGPWSAEKASRWSVRLPAGLRSVELHRFRMKSF